MKKTDDKNYEIFNILSSINLSLEEKNLKSCIDRLIECSKLYSVNNPARKLLKKNIASLTSIYSALNRIPKDKLQEDLNPIQVSIDSIFDEFKLFTGITVARKLVEKKPEKKQVTSFEDLDKLFNIEKPEYIVESEVQENTDDFLTRNLYSVINDLSEKPESTILQLPLIVNATTPNYRKFNRIGLKQRKTPYGVLWLNQYVLVVKKDSTYTRGELEKLALEKTGRRFSWIYEDILRQKYFSDYKFYWIFPIEWLLELEAVRVANCALPFPRGDK